MPSVYGSAAEGVESGFKMGLRIDEVGEDRRRARVRETEVHAAGMRAADELELRKKRDERDERRLADTEKREAGDRAQRMLDSRQKAIIDAQRARQTAGLPVDDDSVKEYGANAEALSRIKQDSLDFWSRVETGQADPSQADPKDVYKHLVAATGMRPEELQLVPQHIADVQAGLETGNQGLLLKGINGVMAPRLRKGVGQPSPHGGTIVRKEIIGLDPARDANGVDHPDKFIPRLRVYVDHPSRPLPSEGGSRQELQKLPYYDAPATEGGGTGPDDKVNAVSIGSAMEFMGQMGTLATAMQHPVMQAKLAEGGKALSKQEQKYLDELTALSKPTKKLTTREKTDLGDRMLIEEVDETGKVVSKREEKKGAVPRVFRPTTGGAAAGNLVAALRAVDEAVANNEITPEEGAEEKRAIRSKIKPDRDTTKGPSNAEQNSAVNTTEQMVADKLKLKYDATLKVYKNLDGTQATPAQLEKLSAARAAASQAVRNASAKKERVSGDVLAKIATDTVGAPPAKSKFETGKVYTNAAGKQAKFGGVDEQGKNIWLAP